MSKILGEGENQVLVSTLCPVCEGTRFIGCDNPYCDEDDCSACPKCWRVEPDEKKKSKPK